MSQTFDRIRRYSTRYIDRPFLALPIPFSMHRRLFEVQARLGSTRPDVPTRWQTIGGVPTRITSPPGALGRLLWLHGGGFTLGSPTTHAALTDHIAVLAGLEVWAPHYRLAPEHPWPCAPDDCATVARAMPGPFHLGGDSAGGNLALVLLHERLAIADRPLSVTLISPVVDLRPDRPDSGGDDEMLLPRAFLRRCQHAYLGQLDGCDPRQSPLSAAYPDCPPVHLELSVREALEQDGHALAAHLRASDAKVTVHSEPGVPHDYHLSAGRSAAANAGIARIVAHIRQTQP